MKKKEQEKICLQLLTSTWINPQNMLNVSKPATKESIMIPLVKASETGKIKYYIDNNFFLKPGNDEHRIQEGGYTWKGTGRDSHVNREGALVAS